MNLGNKTNPKIKTNFRGPEGGLICGVLLYYTGGLIEKPHQDSYILDLALAVQRRTDLIEEAQDHFGYNVHPGSDKFQVMYY